MIVSVRDANQGFSKLIARVEKGERFIVTKNDREVARIEPIATDAEGAEVKRRAAWARIDSLMAERRRSADGWTYKGRRDALHDRSV